MQLKIPCSELYDNLGAFVLRISARDIDGNYYIYHTRLNLRHHLLNNKCCATHASDKLKKALIKKVIKNSKSVSRKDLADIIKKIQKSGTKETEKK